MPAQTDNSAIRMYTKVPKSAAEVMKMRGITDFTNAEMFNLYETGYSFLVVVSCPKYIEKLAESDDNVKHMLETFKYILEYEFRGLSGIEDITADSIEVTDGISTMNVIGKVNKQSATEVSMTFTEKSGSVITNFIKYYLQGIKDPRTQAKTYHGLIKSGKLASGFENEVFNLLYIVTDNTMIQLEQAYLLCNAWPTKAPTSIYESEKGSIDKKEIDVTFQCFVIDGEEVNKRALKMLAHISESGAVLGALQTQDSGSSKAISELKSTNIGPVSDPVQLQSDRFDYNIFDKQFDSKSDVYSSTSSIS